MFFGCRIETPWVNPYRSLGKPPGNGGLSFAFPWNTECIGRIGLSGEGTRDRGRCHPDRWGESVQETEPAILAVEAAG